MPDEITASRRVNGCRLGTTFHADEGSADVPKSSVGALCKGTASIADEGSTAVQLPSANTSCQGTAFYPEGRRVAVPNTTATSEVLTPEVNRITREVSSSNLRSRIDAELDALREHSQFRSLEIPRGIDLCSNDYLALASDPCLHRAVLDAVFASARVGSVGSRLLSGNSRDWEEIESDFANFVGAEAALYFSSGYSANVGLLSSILQPNDVIFSDALNHASLIDGIRLSRARKIIYQHRDLQSLERTLRENANASGAKLIVTESVFSMEGDVAPLESLTQLAQAYSADLIVDEAHAIGVCGRQGRGLVADLPDRSRILAAVYPCGKALASCGAFVCCSASVKNYLINHARSFIFSTANPPYIAHQIRAALALVRETDDRRAHLREISAALRSALIAAGLHCSSGETPIVPVILGSNETALRVAAELQSAGFGVKAIRPLTVPPGTARIRLSLTSAISLDDAHRLAQALITAASSRNSSLAHA